MKKFRIIVSGRVQGVGFRWGVMTLANEIGGIYGRVWNNDDGTVEILAQSRDSLKITDFVSAIRKGPTPMAKVTYLDVKPDQSQTFSDFQIAN